MQLFHYHLATSHLRDVESRYLTKLGFNLVARYGRIGEDHIAVEPGVPWEQLEHEGFKLRLSELERGAVNVVVQPGHWRVPRVDHLGVALDEDELVDTLARAETADLRIQQHSDGRTFVSTVAGYRLELHPPGEWADELAESERELRLAELHLLADDPAAKGEALGEVLDVPHANGAVAVGETLVRFLPGGPPGRPQLHAELFV